jgi:hypothetical protein
MYELPAFPNIICEREEPLTHYQMDKKNNRKGFGGEYRFV